VLAVTLTNSRHRGHDTIKRDRNSRLARNHSGVLCLAFAHRVDLHVREGDRLYNLRKLEPAFAAGAPTEAWHRERILRVRSYQGPGGNSVE
jgi:hypothetical protein